MASQSTRAPNLPPSGLVSSSSSHVRHGDTEDSRALQRAAGDFTTWKVREGLVTCPQQAPPSVDGAPPPEIALAMKNGQPISTIAYAFLRRFAQRKGHESVMVLLEDITQYERISSASSRLKWAKAIVASVQAEVTKNAIMAAVVGPANSSNATINVQPQWQTICSQVAASGTSIPLPDGLFMPIFRAVARGSVRDVLPAFTGSPEHRQLLTLSRSLAQLSAGNGTIIPGPVAQSLLDPAVTISNLSHMPMRAEFYDQLGVIGSGSYGSVYAWRLKLSGQIYAVKVCDKKILKSKNSVHTVVRELACSLAADSPFITTPSFAFHDSDALYIGLPFMEKGDLERWLLAQPIKRFDESTARWYAAQLVLALRRLHECGIIHRDLKASNLLVDKNGYISLTDFGLSVFAHRCSKMSPDYARPCWGEKPDPSQILAACCLGCSLCSKLKALQTMADENEKKGMSPPEAGLAAAESMHMTGLRSDGQGKGSRAYSRGSASRQSRDSRESRESREEHSSEAQGGAGAMPPAALSSTDGSPGKPRSSGFFRMFGARVAGGTGKPVGGLTSAHAISASPLPGQYTSAPMAQVPAHDMDTNMDTNLGLLPAIGSPAAGVVTTATVSALSTGPGPLLTCGSHLSVGKCGHAERDFQDCLSPTAVMRMTPDARVPLEDGFINGTVLVLQDCACHILQDDGIAQWYRGRAGTSAYWSPQMLTRDAQNERCAYSFETDFWSLGCLTYALMTGRSPFASGMGSAYDNSLTVEGRITWPKGVFSTNAKTFISSLCTVDPEKRLGSGRSGWAAVMKHPWFTSGPNPIDWDLLDQRVLPPLSVPSYAVSTSWTRVPDKIANQDKGAAAEEAAAADAAARSAAATAVLTAEDHAIFAACTFTHPHMWRRALLLRAFGMTSGASCDVDMSTGPGASAPRDQAQTARTSRSLPPLPAGGDRQAGSRHSTTGRR